MSGRLLLLWGELCDPAPPVAGLDLGYWTSTILMWGLSGVATIVGRIDRLMRD